MSWRINAASFSTKWRTLTVRIFPKSSIPIGILQFIFITYFLVKSSSLYIHRPCFAVLRTAVTVACHLRSCSFHRPLFFQDVFHIFVEAVDEAVIDGRRFVEAVELTRFRIEPLATKISVTGLLVGSKQKDLSQWQALFCGEPIRWRTHDSSAR